MKPIKPALAVAGAALLAGCVAPPPPQPTVVAFPPQGKSYAAFQQDDGYCRQQAAYQTGGANPAVAAQQNGVASAAVGTAVGAGAGALLGSVSGHMGAGAAIGAALGLVGGSAIGAGNAQATGMSIQRSINIAYAQCMLGHGDRVQGPNGRMLGGPPPGGGYYPPPPPPPPPGYGDEPPPPPQY